MTISGTLAFTSSQRVSFLNNIFSKKLIAEANSSKPYKTENIGNVVVAIF